jgi:hypothetical protein
VCLKLSDSAESSSKRKLGLGSAHNVAASTQEGSGAKKPRTEESQDDSSSKNNGILDLTKPDKVRYYFKL